jgi:ABC-type uncharacterized transport system involved in gliding motility auxiliary subunit
VKGWSALLGALGFVALLFAVIAVLLLVLGGGAASDLPWLWGNLIVGLVLLGVAFATSLDELRARARSGEARRVGKYGTSAIAGTLLGIAILGLLGFLAERNSVRFDWTESGIHSLSDQSQKVLAGLDKDVEVTALYSAVEQPAIRPLLERYGYASPRFKVTWADPTARPDLVESLGAEREKLAGGLLHVKLGAESTFIDDVDEERLTNALVKLTRTAVKRVYFVEGHNERAASGETAAEEGGFARIADALRNENYQVETLVLGTVADVPEDADVVVIGGATRPFLPQEHAALQRYLARGGALLVMLDPMAKTDLYADLKSWGVKLGEDYVIDQVQGLFGRAATPVADRYGDHDITRDLREVTLFHLVRSVRAEEAAKDQFAEIVLTGESSWAETSLDPRPAFGQGDTKGPVPIAVAGTPKLDGVAPPPVSAEGEQAAGEDEKKTPRLVVFGDSDFVTNELIDAYRNRDLFLNAVNWLLGDVQAISIRPNQARASRFQLTSEQFQSLRALSLFVLPQLLAALGAFAWWSRRRAPGR